MINKIRPFFKNERVFNIIIKKYHERFFRLSNKINFLLIFLVILCFLFFCITTISNELKKTNVTKLNERWTFIVKKHSDNYIFGKTEKRLLNVQPNSPLVMQQHLEMSLKDPQLVVRTNHQWLLVYVGEKLIYRYTASEKQKEPGLLQTAIHLPHDYQQQKLRIVTKTPYEYYAGIPAQVFIGEANEVNRFFILRSLPQFFLLMICSVLVVTLFVLLFLKPIHNKKSIAISMLLIGFTLLVGIQSLVLNVPASTVFGPKSSSILYNLTTILIPVFLTNYYLLRTKKYHQYYLFGVASQVFLLAFGLICIAIDKLSLPMAVQIFSGFNVFMTLYTSAIALAESADRNHFYTICAPGIIMAAFIHCFFYIQLFAGAANLTTDWPLILFSGLMLLISGYQIEADVTEIQQTHQLKQEQQQECLLIKEKQKNLVVMFKLLAEKKTSSEEQQAALAHLLPLMKEYYLREFQKQGKFFSCHLYIGDLSVALTETNLSLLVQLFEKFLTDKSFGSIDLSIKQHEQQLLIESRTSSFTRHSFDESLITIIDHVDSHQELEQAVKCSNGQWYWHKEEKQQHFKITLDV